MPDLYTATLARCDELETIARALGGREWKKQPTNHFGVVRIWTGRNWWGSSATVATTSRRADAEQIGYLIAAFGPAAVLSMVAGAREICGIHVLKITHPLPNFGPDSCAEDYDVWPCRTLCATARMIGVKADA